MRINRILIATNNKKIKTSLTNRFLKTGIAKGKLLHCSTVASAFQLFKRHQSGIDAVVVDMGLPSAINLISNIRQYEEEYGLVQVNIIVFGIQANLRDIYLQKARAIKVVHHTKLSSKIINELENLGF